MSATPTSVSPGPTSTPPLVSPANPQLLKIKIDALPESLIQVLMLQNIGALELTSMTRYDMIDGVETIYQPIKDVQSVASNYNIKNVVDTSSPAFTGNAGYEKLFGWTEFDKDMATGQTAPRPIEYSFMNDELGFNVDPTSLGVNEVLEVEVMDFDPDYYNYFDDDILDSVQQNRNFYTADYQRKEAWGMENFINVNDDTYNDSSGTNGVGFFDFPRGIVYVDPAEYNSLRDAASDTGGLDL